MKVKFMIIVALLASQIAHAANTVYVATNREQPPYTLEDGSGLVIDLVNALNAIQFDYKFEVAPVVSDRAKAGIANGTYDMIAMNNVMWGYQGLDVVPSVDLLEVQDQYFALSSNVDSQAFFDKIGTPAAKTNVVKGFSYNFLGFEQDVKVLKNQFNTSVVLDEPTVVKMVLSKRADIGVSSSTNLQYHKILNPGDHEKLTIAEKVDSTYYRHFILSQASSISVEEFNALMKKLADDGVLKDIFARYGLTPAL